MFCPNCRNKMNNYGYENVCPYCGTRMAGNTVMPRQPYSGPTSPVRYGDSGSMFGWGLLGFFMPMVGLILYLVWKDDYPKKAKAAGKGALISVILGVVAAIISIIIFIVMAATLGNVDISSVVENGEEAMRFLYNFTSPLLF